MEVELVAITPNPEEVIEAAARTCYQSSGTGNKNNRLLLRLIQMGHESPLEHAYATFRIWGCSRAMTHQLVRHRLMSVSQKSQRYVAEGDFEYVIPPAIKKKDEADFIKDMEKIGAMYTKWKDRGLKNEDARFVLPNACATELVVSANFREFRHIFKLRCSPHAQWEIRTAATMMLQALHKKAPTVFDDIMQLAGKAKQVKE